MIGLLNGFKDSNYIYFKAGCGKSGTVKIQATDEWKKMLKRNYSG